MTGGRQRASSRRGLRRARRRTVSNEMHDEVGLLGRALLVCARMKYTSHDAGVGECTRGSRMGHGTGHAVTAGAARTLSEETHEEVGLLLRLLAKGSRLLLVLAEQEEDRRDEAGTRTRARGSKGARGWDTRLAAARSEPQAHAVVTRLAEARSWRACTHKRRKMTAKTTPTPTEMIVLSSSSILLVRL